VGRKNDSFTRSVHQISVFCNARERVYFEMKLINKNVDKDGGGYVYQVFIT
jgi:hypothetical protein